MVEDTDYEIPRQFSRVPFSHTSWVFALKLENDEQSSMPLQLEAQNIGLGGVRFLSNKKIKIFTRVIVQLLDKEGKKPPLTLEGKVIRVDETDVGLEEKTFGMAVEFDPLTTKAEILMKSVIEKPKK